MSETEQLLMRAQDMARRTFEDPSESAVMDLFRELCTERDRITWSADCRENATLH